MGLKILLSDCWTLLSLLESRHMIKVKVVPWPWVDLQTISPSSICKILLVMCRPSPIPWVLISLLASRKPNSLKSLCISSSLMPIPVSQTCISKNVLLGNLFRIYSKISSWTERSCRSLTNLALTFILPPPGVNLTAFDTKFISTCCILCLSDLI